MRFTPYREGRRRTTKPPGLLQVNWSHELAQGLAAFVPLTERRGLPREVVSQSLPDNGVVIVETPSTTQNGWEDRHPFWDRRYLPYFRGGAAPGPQWSDALSRLAGIPEGANLQLTAAMFVDQFGASGAAQTHWGKVALTAGWELGKDAAQRWKFHVGPSLSVAVTPTALTVNHPYFIVGRCRYPDLDIRSINLRTGLVETGTGSISSVPSDTALALQLASRSSTDRINTPAAIMWKRYLSDAEIDRWFDDPWGLLVQPTPRTWFLPVPPAVTNTNITPPAGALIFSGIVPTIQQTIVPAGIASAEAFGTHALVDAATTIAPSGIASAEAFGSHEIIDDIGAAGTIEPSGIASAEAFGTAAITETAIISPTGIASAFDMDLHSVGVAVGTIAPFGIASEEAFSQVSAGGGINGGITVVTPTNPPATSGTVTAKKLCAPLGLIRAEVTSTAQDQAVVLPDVYGDFSTGGLRGPCPAVLVNNTSPFIYIAAAHPVKEITKVYVDDVEQASGFATITAVDLGVGFQVAVIAFSTQPTGQVSWRGKGRMNDSLTLIENPIEQLETILKHRNSWTTEDFDATTLAEAKAAATAAGWTTAFVFADDRQVQDWITEVLFNVMGFWRVSGRAQLQVTLDPGGSAFPQSDLVDSLVASRDCIDGDDGITFVADRQHLVNKLEAYYLYSWSLGQPSSRLVDLDDELSQNAHGELRKSVTLRGLRSSTQVTAWADILFERQSFAHRVEGATVQFRVKGSRLIHVTVGDLIAFTWPYGPTRESGNQYVNEILRVLTASHDVATGGIVTITAIDTGAFVQSGGTRLLTPLAL